MKSAQLIADLVSIVNQHIEKVQTFQSLSTAQLNAKPNEKAWSILECIEHLNRYGDFYISEIRKRIQSSKHTSSDVFTPTKFGNKTVLSMLPTEDMKTMKTFKSKNPIGSQLDVKVLDTFLEQQNQMLVLLEQAKSVDLTKTKTRITLPLMKFRLGDTLRFVIYHNERHVVQAEHLLI